MKTNTIIQGDCFESLKTLPDESIQCCVTSPPYFGLRNYGCDGQLGLEKTPEEYIERMVEVFREVKRVLRKDGTLWLNLGDSYAGSGRGNNEHGKQRTNKGTCFDVNNPGFVPNGLKPKDLVGIPWMLAFAIRADGWYLRSEIIWHKPNPMPESVTDRPTKSHEQIFLLSKSQKYYYDHEAIKEKANYDGRKDTMMKGSEKYKTSVVPGQAEHTMASNGHERWQWKDGIAMRNKRSVWTVNLRPFKKAHFATFPPKLIEPCILAGCPAKVCSICGSHWERQVETTAGTSKECPKTQLSHNARGGVGIQSGTVGKSGSGRINGITKTIGFEPTCKCNSGTTQGIVLDPFMGAGTVGLVAVENNRNYIGCELNPEYIKIARQRITQAQPQLF